MYINKFSVRKDSKITGYGMYNTENGSFAILDKNKAITYAKRGMLKPYAVGDNGIVAVPQANSIFDKLSGRYKVESLAMDRCNQICGYLDENYMISTIPTIIGEYIYIESNHERLYMVGTLYVPVAEQYGAWQQLLAAAKCIVRGSGRYSMTNEQACVSFDNVYDLRNLLYIFNNYELLMDVSHVREFDYDIAGETLMYEKICENEKNGLYFAELDSIHKYIGLISYTRGVSNIRCDAI